MSNFFNMDNKFFVIMGRIADLAIVNILCILCCLPIVTAGASITALYYVTLKMARNEESYIVRSFFKSFKTNFRQSTIIHLIMLATGIFLYVDLRLAGQMEGSFSKALSVIFTAFAFVYGLILLYIYPVLAKFYNSIKNTFVNACLMAVRHLPYTIIMVLITLCPILILFIPSLRIQSMLLMLFLIMGIGTVAYCNSLFFVKIFDHYVPKEEEPKDELLTELPEETIPGISADKEA